MTIKNDLLTIKQSFNMDGYNLKELYKDDKIKLKTEFNMFVDSLQKDNVISEKTAQNVYLSRNKKGMIIMYCLSYSMQIG